MINDPKIAVPNPVMRHQVADYLMVGEAYELMGVGFEALDESPNAQSTQKTYVNQATASNFVNAYQTEFPFTADLIKSEKALMELYKCGRDHLTGTAAMFKYCRVDLFDEAQPQKANTFKAREFIVSCEVSSNTGKGGDPMALAGTLKCVGDPILGSFDTTTKKFTPDGASEGP